MAHMYDKLTYVLETCINNGWTKYHSLEYAQKAFDMIDETTLLSYLLNRDLLFVMASIRQNVLAGGAYHNENGENQKIEVKHVRVFPTILAHIILDVYLKQEDNLINFLYFYLRNEKPDKKIYA